MQTFIVTVGTSLLTNRDENLANPRPWAAPRRTPTEEEALAWMRGAEMGAISAETNTLFRLIDREDDAIHLLHSDTEDGTLCANILKRYLCEGFGQSRVALHALPGVSYDLEEPGPLSRLASLVDAIIAGARDTYITLAATAGFKAEVMMLAIIGNAYGLPVCYLHEQFRGLVYLPHYQRRGELAPIKGEKVSLPDSGVPREQVCDLSGIEHHGRKKFARVIDNLVRLPWVDKIRFEGAAKNAPSNGVKPSPRAAKDGRHLFWIHLRADGDETLYLAVETTGYTPQHQEEAVRALRETLGRR